MHSTEYVDPYKSVQPTFIDVFIGATPYAKQIETALEESIISNAQGYFYPNNSITREDAADIYVKAFKIPVSATNALSGFTDAGGPVDWLLVGLIWGGGLVGTTILGYALMGLMSKSRLH